MDADGIAELISESRWRVDLSEDGHGLGVDFIRRYLEGIRREDLDGVITALEARASVSNPMAGTQYERSGSWSVGRHWMSWEQDSGGQPLRLRVWEVLFQGAGSRLANTVTERSCAVLVETTWYVAQSTLPSLPATGNGITYRMGPVVENPETGRLTTYIEKRTRLYQTTGAYTAEERADESTAVVKHLGVKSGDLTDGGASIGLVTAAAGQIVSTDRSRNEDCTSNVQQGVRSAIDQTQSVAEVRADVATATTIHTQRATDSLPTTPPVPAAGEVKSVRIEPTEFKDRARTIEETRTVTDQTPAATVERADETVATAIHTAASAALTPPAAAAGQVVETSSTPTEFKDRHRTEVRTRSAIDQTQSVAEVRADVATATTIHTQRATDSLPTTPPVPAAGEVKSVRIEPTEFKDRARTIEETRTVTDQTPAATVERADETVTTAIHTAASAALTPPAAAAGQVVETSSTPTEFKDRHRTEVRTRSAIDQTQSVAEVRADVAVATTIHTQRATGSLPTTPPVPGAGEVKSVRIEPTEFKDRARTIEETRTAVDQTQSVAEVRADVAVATTIHTQRAVGSLPTTPPVPAAGEVKSVRIEPTEFKDRARTIEETRTVTDQTPAATVERADETVTTAIHTAASAALTPPAAAAGQVVETSSTPTEFKDRHRTEVRTRSAIDQTQSVAEVRGDQTLSVTIHTQRSTDSLPTTPPEQEDGKIRVVRIEPTEFKDRARTTEETRTRLDNGVAAYLAEKGKTRKVFLTIYDGAEEQPALTSEYGTLRVHRDEFRRWVGEKQEIEYYPENSAVLRNSFSDSIGRVRIEIEKQPYPASSGQGYRWRKILKTWNITHHTTSGSAYDKLDGGLWGSNVVMLVVGQVWEARKVVKVKYGAWSEAAPNLNSGDVD